jgi:acyl-CoA thioester hydrolase
MGHQNSSFYVAQAHEGWATLAAALKLPREVVSALRPTCHHIRFIRELRAGTALHMRGAVTELREDGLRLVQVLVRSEDDVVCATILSDLRYFDAPVPFDLRDYGREARLFYSSPIDAFVQAVPDRVCELPNLERAERAGMVQTALGVFGPTEVGLHVDPLVAPDAVVRRIGDGTRFLSRRVERAAQEAETTPLRLGSAALECRLDYFHWPKVGDRFAIRSAFATMGPKSRRVVHWMFDADTAQPLCAVRTLEVNFDLDRRRAREVDAGVRQALQRYVIDSLNA